VSAIRKGTKPSIDGPEGRPRRGDYPCDIQIGGNRESGSTPLAGDPALKPEKAAMNL